MNLSNVVAVLPGAESRRRSVENAFGSLRLEGLEIDAEARAIFDRYITRELHIGELMPRLRPALAVNAHDSCSEPGARTF